MFIAQWFDNFFWNKCQITYYLPPDSLILWCLGMLFFILSPLVLGHSDRELRHSCFKKWYSQIVWFFSKLVIFVQTCDICPNWSYLTKLVIFVQNENALCHCVFLLLLLQFFFHVCHRSTKFCTEYQDWSSHTLPRGNRKMPFWKQKFN